MRPLLFVIVLVTGTFCAGLVRAGQGTQANSSGKTDATSRTRQELEAALATQDEAIKKNDFKAFVQTLARGYSVKLLSGDSLSREQIENYVRTIWLTLRPWRSRPLRSICSP
jgi:hypothetical protein